MRKSPYYTSKLYLEMNGYFVTDILNERPENINILKKIKIPRASL